MDIHPETVLRQIDEQAWAIEQDFVRCFLIVGEEKVLLLDTGAEPVEIMGLIRSVTDREVVLVQTHGDGDHTANSGRFPVIYAHPAEFDVILRFRPELAGLLRPVREGDVFDLGGFALEVVEAPALPRRRRGHPVYPVSGPQRKHHRLNRWCFRHGDLPMSRRRRRSSSYADNRSYSPSSDRTPRFRSSGSSPASSAS